MNGNFRNSYRGGWNNTPFDNFSREQFNYNYQIPHVRGFHYPMPAYYYDMRHPTYQMPAHYPAVRPLTHQIPAHYVDNMHLAHQRPEHYADKRHLPKQKPKHYADKRPLPQQPPKDSADKEISPHKKPEDFADKTNVLHQKAEDCTDKKCLPQQTPEHIADKRDLPQQKPEYYADKRPLLDQPPKDLHDKRNLPHQKPEDNTDNKCLLPQQTPDLPQQTPKDYADKNGLPHQTSKPTVPVVAQAKCPKAATKNGIPHQTSKPTVPAVAQVKCPKAATKNGLPHQTSKPTVPAVAPVKCPKAATKNGIPHQTSKPTVPAVAPVKCPKAATKNGIPHQTSKPTVPAVAQVKCPKAATKNGLPHQMSKPTVPAVAQVKCPKAATKNGLPHQMSKPTVPAVAQVKCPKAATKNGLPHQMSKPTVPAVAPVKCPKAGTVFCEICDVSIPDSQNTLESHYNGRKHRRNLSKLCEQSTECKTSKEHHVIQNCALKRNDQSESISMDLHGLAGSNTSASTKDTCSGSDAIAIAPPQGPMTSQINSQTKVEERKEHHEVQNGGVKDCAAKKCLPHQMPKPTIPSDKKCLTRQMPESTIPSDDKSSTTRCEICHCTISRKYIEDHNNGRKHQRKVMELKISKGEVSGHTQSRKRKRKSRRSELSNESQMNPVVQPKKVPKSMKDGRPVETTSQFRCKEVPAEGSKRKLEDHTVAKDHGLKLKEVKNEAPSFNNKKVPAERSKRKVSDTTDAKDHGSKREIGETSGAKYMKTNSGIRRPAESSKSEVNALSNSVKSLVQIPELTPPSGCVASPKMAPFPEEKNDQPHVSASLSQESKGKEHHKIQNTTVEKSDQPQSTPVELNPSEGSNRTESMSCDFAAIAPPQVPVNCPVFTPSPAVESSLEPSIQTDSQIEVEEGKENHDVQNCCVETNDQPESITMELHANGGSDINTLIKEDTCSDSGAIVIIPSQSPISSQVPTPVAAVESSFEPESQQVIQTETSVSKVHNEIQNHTVDSNDQQQSISMELDNPAGCMTKTQTEVVNSDSAAIAIVIEPLASAPPDAVWSGFEPLSDSEIEPQVSEAVVYYESHHLLEETDIELPPSVPMETDAASEVSTETETADGSPQAEVEMDVLVDEPGMIQLPQVSVCLTCGDEGFEEAIVYCYKCKGYAIHRYCLDGPVIFTDEVIWFCADCEEEVIDTDYPDQVTSDSEKGEVGCSNGCVTVVDPQPIADPIWRGSLQVFHKRDDKITRLMAHLSTLACPKVLEETKHLPNVLYGNLLQRSAVWPASFKKFGTNNLSIGLYFFPQNESVERYYDQLVHEMITNDLAISAKVEKSELLIFASTMLPSQYKRFQSKYYLWGIFIRKQTPSKINDAGS